MLWGIDDKTHEIVGTKYNLQTLKKGNQELENWLRSLLSKNADFEFHSVTMNGMTVGVLIIYRAANQTVMFEKVDYIRVGSYTKKLNEYPTVQAQLWDRIRNTKFEERYAKQDLELADALRLLDYAVYFDIRNIPQPSDNNGVAHYMMEEGMYGADSIICWSTTAIRGTLWFWTVKRLSSPCVRVALPNSEKSS